LLKSLIIFELSDFKKVFIKEIQIQQTFLFIQSAGNFPIFLFYSFLRFIKSIKKGYQPVKMPGKYPLVHCSGLIIFLAKLLFRIAEYL
jgi:hypothetical protein